jgi:hypothetical protein
MLDHDLTQEKTCALVGTGMSARPSTYGILCRDLYPLVPIGAWVQVAEGCGLPSRHLPLWTRAHISSIAPKHIFRLGEKDLSSHAGCWCLDICNLRKIGSYSTP